VAENRKELQKNCEIVSNRLFAVTRQKYVYSPQKSNFVTL